MRNIIIFLLIAILFKNIISCDIKENINPDIKNYINEETGVIEIRSANDWQDFVEYYNSNKNEYIEYIYVEIITEDYEFNIINVESVGTEINPFNGEIDFNNNNVTYSNNLVGFSNNVAIKNINITGNNVRSALVGYCNFDSVFENIVISGPDNIFNNSILINTSNYVKINCLELSDTIIYGYEIIGGLIGKCIKLDVYDLKMGNIIVKTTSGGGSLHNVAALIAYEAEEVYFKDSKIISCISFARYPSHGFNYCKKLIVENVEYSNCHNIPTINGTVLDIVGYGLEEFIENNFIFK